MKAKQKAKELYSKYYNRIEHTLSEEYSPHEIDVVKQCALIAVDEIFKTVSMCIPYRNESTYSSYWQEVKEEINKL